MDSTLAEIWSFFAAFPPGLASQAGGWVVGIVVVTAILIIVWRRSPKLSTATQWTPLALYGLTWLLRWLADWAGNPVSGWLWIIFSLLTLTSLIWGVVNLVRVIVNK